MILDTAQLSAIGDRSSNQDALAHACVDGLSCFVLADGTGGHAGGEVAAALATSAILEKFLLEASFSTRALGSYVAWASAEVALKKHADARYSDMSTTVACVLIDQSNRCALCAHLGDTRIYMFRLGKIISISKDHSMAQRLVDAGYANFAQIRRHPQRSQLFAAIGAEGDSTPEISPAPIALQDGDAFLLCSDGFWEWISEAEMEQSLSTATSSEDWLNAMHSIAEKNNAAQNGRRDNFSAFTICVHDDLTSRPLS
jgi:serine/threonine protein phosphatase PrpC